MTARRRWQVSIGVGVLAVVAGTAAAYFVSTRRDVTTSSQEAYELYRKGRENEQKLYRREASAAYAEALAKDPDFFMAMLRLGVISQDKDPDRSRSLLQSASKFRDSVSTRERRTFDIWAKLIVDKDVPAAEKLTDEYLKAYPDEPEGYQFRALQLMKAGKSDKAMEVFTRLLAVNPNYAIAYNNIGYYWMARGDYAKAEDNLKRYRFLAPDQANPFDSLGELYANTGRYEEAEENLRRALELKPDFVPAIGHLGAVAVGRGDFVGGTVLYQKAARLSDNISSGAQFTLAEVLCTFEAGDRTAALALLDASPIFLGEPTERTKDVREIGLLIRSGIMGEGVARLPAAAPPIEAGEAGEAGREGDRASRDLAFGLVRLLEEVRKGDLTGTRSFVEKELPAWASRNGAFGYYPYIPILWVHLADLLGRTGATGEAGEILKVVLARNPRFRPALDAQGRVRGEAGAATLTPTSGT